MGTRLAAEQFADIGHSNEDSKHLRVELRTSRYPLVESILHAEFAELHEHCRETYDNMSHACKVRVGETPKLYANDRQLDLNVRLMSDYIARTRKRVLNLEIRPASPASTDRMVVVFLPDGLHAPSPPSFGLAYSLRATLERLGPRWGLQVFYDDTVHPSYERIVEQLGVGAQNTVFTPIAFARWLTTHGPEPVSGWAASKKGICDYNNWRSSPELYRSIDPRHEHLLFLEADGILLKRGCIDRFLNYSLIGAPWKWSPFIGNGGFTLRHRSTMLRIIEAHPVNHRCHHEDDRTSRLLLDDWHERIHFDVSIPSVEEAKQFAVETLFYDDPCGIHKPWLYMKGNHLQTILNNADNVTEMLTTQSL